MLSEENGNVIGIVAVVVILFFTALGLVTFGIYSFTDDYARGSNPEDEQRMKGHVQSPKQAGGKPPHAAKIAKQAPAKKEEEQMVFIPTGRGKPEAAPKPAAKTVVHIPKKAGAEPKPPSNPEPEAAPQPFVPKSQPGTFGWVKEMCEHERFVRNVRFDDKNSDLLVELNAPSAKTLPQAGPSLFKATRDCMLYSRESEIEFRRLTVTALSKIEGRQRKALELTYTRKKLHDLDFEEPIDVVKSASKAYVHKLLKETKQVVRRVSRMRQFQARLAAQRISAARASVTRPTLQKCVGGS